MPPVLLAEGSRSFTRHCGNTVVARTQNKSQYTKLTLEKKILPPPVLPGFEPATFRSRVRRSNQQAIPASIHKYISKRDQHSGDIGMGLKKKKKCLYCLGRSAYRSYWRAGELIKGLILEMEFGQVFACAAIAKKKKKKTFKTQTQDTKRNVIIRIRALKITRSAFPRVALISK